MSVRGPIRRALDRSVLKSDRNPRDQGTLLLARLYADQLFLEVRIGNHAARLHAASLMILAEIEPGDVMTKRYVQKLADSLSARQCVIDIGPKFLAALAALHLTTAARVTAKTGEQTSNAPALDTTT